jgi:hypothetical protein
MLRDWALHRIAIPQPQIEFEEGRDCVMRKHLRLASTTISDATFYRLLNLETPSNDGFG